MKVGVVSIPHGSTNSLVVLWLCVGICGCATNSGAGHGKGNTCSSFQSNAGARVEPWYYDFGSIARAFRYSVVSKDPEHACRLACGFSSPLPWDRPSVSRKMLEMALARYLLAFIDAYKRLSKDVQKAKLLPAGGCQLEKSLLDHLSPDCVAKAAQEAKKIDCWKHALADICTPESGEQACSLPALPPPAPTYIFTPELTGRACMLLLLSQKHWRHMADSLAGYMVFDSPYQRARSYCRLFVATWSLACGRLPWAKPGRDTEFNLIRALPKNAVLSVFMDFLRKKYFFKTVVSILEVTNGLLNWERLSEDEVISELGGEWEADIGKERRNNEEWELLRKRWLEWCERQLRKKGER